MSKVGQAVWSVRLWSVKLCSINCRAVWRGLRSAQLAVEARPKKTAPAGAVFMSEQAHRLLRGFAFYEIRELHRLATLDDGDRRDGAVRHREDRHFRILAVTLLVEFDMAAGAVVFDPGKLRQVLRRIGRIGGLHCGNDQVGRIV